MTTINAQINLICSYLRPPWAPPLYREQKSFAGHHVSRSTFVYAVCIEMAQVSRELSGCLQVGLIVVPYAPNAEANSHVLAQIKSRQTTFHAGYPCTSDYMCVSHTSISH